MATHDDKGPLFDVVGDMRDPAGIDPHARGVAPGYDFTKHAGKPLIWVELGTTRIPVTWDVFPAIPGEPAWIQGICPQCVASHPLEDASQYGLTIREDKKPFEFNPKAEVPPFPGFSRREMAAIKRPGLPDGPGGLLSIEKPIRCDRCGWHVLIANNVARPVR